jgi:hypothetical protein
MTPRSVLRRASHELAWALTPASRRRRARSRRWVFVTGCNRSGKTIVANLLGEHPAVAVVPNAASHTRALPSSADLGCPHVWTEKADRFALGPADDVRPAARLAFDWMRFPREDRPILVVESDLALAQMTWLQEVFPDPLFIGLVRNGYAVAEGIRLKEGYTLSRCARHWAEANRTMLRDAARVRRFELLTYERLTGDPRGTVRGLAGLLGLEPDELLSAVDSGWRLGNTDAGRSFVRDANAELVLRLTPEERGEIEAEAGEMLRRLGYGGSEERASAPAGLVGEVSPCRP